jgi:hypothetical protein
MNEIEKRIELAKRQLVSQRNYRRVRDRALAKLAKAHPEEYLHLLEREKESDEKTGKRWLDITGSSIGAFPIQSYKDATEGAVDPSSGENESYYGGEE